MSIKISHILMLLQYFSLPSCQGGRWICRQAKTDEGYALFSLFYQPHHRYTSFRGASPFFGEAYNSDKQSCKNCKHFFQHYGWIAGSFRKIDCGHCLKKNLTQSDYKIFPFIGGCDDWEYIEKEIAGREENLKRTLTRMAIQLNEIKVLLENDYLKP